MKFAQPRRLTVFCGSSVGADGAYAEVARDLGDLLVQRSYGLVYGGAMIGLMGVLADAVLRAGGEVIGVIPQGLARQEVAGRLPGEFEAGAPGSSCVTALAAMVLPCVWKVAPWKRRGQV